MPDAGKDAEEIEELAAAVHQAYLDTCARLGWEVKPSNLVPYAELSEDSKELDRASVRVVLSALQQQLAEARQELGARYDWNDDPRTKGLAANYVAAACRAIEAEQERDRYKAALERINTMTTTSPMPPSPQTTAAEA